MGVTITPGPASAATSAPKLVARFTTDVNTLPGDFVIVDGSNSVIKIDDNAISTIPHGVFGVGYYKPDSTTIDVIFSGIKDGYSGFTTGEAIYIDVDGTPTHTAPSTGIVQQVGFAISSNEFFVQLQQAFARD